MCSTCSHHTLGMHRGVNVTFTAGRWGAWLASLSGGCSSISIALLLVSQEIPRKVHGSLHTLPIQCMGNPLNVRGKTVTEIGIVGHRCNGLHPFLHPPSTIALQHNQEFRCAGKRICRSLTELFIPAMAGSQGQATA